NTSGRARLAPRIAASDVLISTAPVGHFSDTSIKSRMAICSSVDEIARSRLFYRAAPTSWRHKRMFEEMKIADSGLAASGSFKSHELYWRSQITHNHRTMVGRKNIGMERRYPIGAEIIGENETHFRVWAPKAKKLAVVSDNKTYSLTSEAGGYFAGSAHFGAGARYKLQIGDGPAFPDPASRFQPEGPHGPSCVVDPFLFQWTDASWRGVKLAGQIIYEMHIGTFTPAGTWRAAIDKLADLKETGITLVEVMPI